MYPWYDKESNCYKGIYYGYGSFNSAGGDLFVKELELKDLVIYTRKLEEDLENIKEELTEKRRKRNKRAKEIRKLNKEKGGF